MFKIIIDNDKLKRLFNESHSVMELAKKLGYKKYYNGNRLSGTIYKIIRRKCNECNLDYLSINGRRNYEKYDNLLKTIVPQCKSIAEVCKRLDLPINNSNLYSKLRYRISHLNLDISHFTGASWSRGSNRFTDNRLNKMAQATETPWEKTFCKNGKVKNESLIKRLIINKKLEYKCSICGINKWNQKPIRLRLDHIDGDSTNNCEYNLRLLCPNCDSQTDTFCRGTKKRKQKLQWWEALVGESQTRSP